MYLEFYGLTESPFNLTPDTNFLFPSRVHREVLAHLLYGVNSRKGFIMLSGEVGSGKTTICRALLSKLGPNTEVALVLNSFLSELELLKAINEDLGIQSKGQTRKELIDELNDFLLGRRMQGKNVVVIVDEAQNLSFPVLEQIRMLSNLETEKEKLLQIVLVGQPELRRLLATPRLRQLNQRITVRHHITPLTRKETIQYIYHRLKVAGSRGSLLFTESALSEICRFSGGIPRMINVICDQTLLSGYVANSTKIDRSMVRAAEAEIEGTAKPPLKLLSPHFSLSRVGAVAGLVLAALLIAASALRPVLKGILFPERTASRTKNSQDASLARATGGSPERAGDRRPDRSSTEKPVPRPPDSGKPPETASAAENREIHGERLLPPPSLMRLASLAGATSRVGHSLSAIFREDMQPLFSRKTPALASLPPRPKVKLAAVTAAPKAQERGVVAYRSFVEPVFALLRQWKRPPAIVEAVRQRYGEVGEHLPSLAAAARMGWASFPADLQTLRMIDIPAIIEVSGDGGQQKGYVTLVALGETWAEIVTASGTKRVGLHFLSTIIRGSVTVLCDDSFVSPDPLRRGQGISLKVRKLQDYMRAAGYFEGNPSGWFTPATTAAVMAFQKDHGLPASGEADARTKLLLYAAQAMPQAPRLYAAN